MHEMVGSEVIRIGSAGDQKDGKFFGVSSGQSIERRERSNAKGDDASGRAIRARIAFRGKRAIQFVTALNLLQVLVF